MSRLSKKPPREFMILAVGLWMWCGQGLVHALTVTAVTSDNGYPAHKVQWTDNAGLPRTAIMVDQNSTGAGPYTGYLRRFTYVVNGQTRTCTGITNYATGGDLETSGDGFVQNHTADGGDFSTGNGAGTPGTTTITLQGSSHVLITYNIPTYKISGQTVPTTIQWLFADGRANPIFSITQDSRSTSGNLGADSRSPYGDMAYDGDGVDALVGGYSYGDQYKFVTLATNPEQVSNLSPWKATETNTIPYAMQWAQPATVDAEMGHVATAPISLIDQGEDTQTSQYDDPPDLFDPRTKTSTGPLPPANTQAYQIIGYSLNGNSTTDSKRLTWGANFGRVGGFDNYGDSSLNVTQYSQHSNDPVNSPLAGTRADGLLMAYSVFIVFGPHGGAYPAKAYETGTVGQMVTQMQNAAAATLSASTGSVLASGPKGVGNAAGTTMTYSPAGYNPVYSTWEVEAAGNAVNATLTPSASAMLDHPLFVVDGYTSAQLPGYISVGSGLTTAGVDYFATLDTTGQRLWITVNRAASSPVNLIVQATAPTVTFSQWEALYGISSGDTATPENDGVSNLMKYFGNINPTRAMTSLDRSALPHMGLDTTTTPGTQYLTLTFRQYASETGLTMNFQTSPDLQTWTTVTPNITQQVGTDPNTGDPIMEVEVNSNGAPRDFLRLQIQGP